ncbi:hypothetical protein DSECCO2_393090 [anaerobic digester metagenome]
MVSVVNPALVLSDIHQKKLIAGMLQVGVSPGIVISIFKGDLSEEIKGQQSLNEDQEISSHVSEGSFWLMNMVNHLMIATNLYEPALVRLCYSYNILQDFI